MVTHPAWLPNWSGDIAAVVASGQSATQTDLTLLRGRCRILAINRAFELAPFGSALYAADGAFWTHYPAARQFAGIKITADRNAASHWGLHQITVDGAHRIQVDAPGRIGHGGNGGFQAINLAVQFGARRILLIGIDLCGEHWHEAHKQPLRNPKPQTLEKWRKRLDAQAAALAALGVTVYNCSMCSALTAYPKMPIAEALETAEREIAKRSAA